MWWENYLPLFLPTMYCSSWRPSSEQDKILHWLSSDSKISLVQNSWTVLFSLYLNWSQVLWSIIVLLFCEWNISFSNTQVFILRFEEKPDSLYAKKKEKSYAKRNCKAVGWNLLFCSVLGPAVSKGEECRTLFCGGLGQGAHLWLFIQCWCCSSVNVGLVLYTTSANASATLKWRVISSYCAALPVLNLKEGGPYGALTEHADDCVTVPTP